MGISKNMEDKPFGNFARKIFKKQRTQHVLLALFFYISIFIILVSSLKPEKFDLALGERVPVDIRSPKDIEDRWATERLREKAAESVELRYKIDPVVHIEVKKDIERFFALIYDLQGDEELSLEAKMDYMKEQNDLNIQEKDIQTALNAPGEKLKYLESYIYDIIAQNMNMGINVEDLQKEKVAIREYIHQLRDFDDSLKDLATSLVFATIRPNKFLDEEVTQQKRQEAIDNVEKVMIRKGDNIVREGEILTLDRFEILRDLGILTEESKFDFILYLGIAGIVLVLELLLIAYIYAFNKQLLEKVERLLMMCIIIIFTLVIAKAMHLISIYLIPVALSAMLLSILIESRLALLVNVCLTILISMITGNDVIFIVMALVGGTIGAFSVINTQQRVNIFLSGIVVSLANVATIIGVGFINSSEIFKVLGYGFYGILNGILCAILTVGSLPLWESVFRVVTPLKLLELSNPNQPLLKKLLLEAPGTYHHSIIVGNLSESAADAVGGNSLLARVGAFYHDIGKTKRPYFFKENQLTAENPHDKLKPSLSTLIITDHVKDGVELAKKHKLPEEIRHFIEQHHGNTLVAYFYHKAKKLENLENVEEESFRYKGPKPQNKETAIVMLADSVEAAVRSLSSPTKEKIENLIGKIIDDKLADGQLDESNLTLKELNLIRNSFIKVIQGIFHERIEYPDMEGKDGKGKKAYEPSH